MYRMKRLWRNVLITICVLYVLVSLTAVYKLYCLTIEKGADQSNRQTNHVEKKSLSNKINDEESRVEHNVEIWGKAAIANYLWFHILEGTVKDVGNLVHLGNKVLNNINFTYRYGPGIIQTTVPRDVENIVLVLNGRSEDKIHTAKQWLNYLPLYKKLKHMAVVLLGNEGCHNDWILPHIKSRGGRIDALFVVYDSLLVDNYEIFQWPLGVAVYRGFPNVKPNELDLHSPRSLTCNFLGTVYRNSSRVVLTELINSGLQNTCYLKIRKKWKPNESADSLKLYMDTILKSDLTLSPVGRNTECYRIYEAMSLGSVPVIENIATPGECDSFANSPLRLLKKYDAPVIYIKNWKHLRAIVHAETLLGLEEKAERRVRVTDWYKNFKILMRDSFLRIIKKKLLQ